MDPITFKVEDPESIKFTMTITLSLENWAFVEKQLDGIEDMEGVVLGIREMVRMTQRNYRLKGINPSLE